MAGSAPQTVTVDGRLLRLTNSDKLIYPATGTTKAEVIAYYVEVAPWLLPHLAGRPVTRKRWVDGTGHDAQVFFEKNLPDSAPSWIRRVTIKHKSHTNTYPIFESVADLAWAGQVAALELHVPQWRVDATGVAQNPDRLVIDLDPGPGVGLPECVEVAHAARELLADVGLECVPVTSGSKGIHLYAPLDGQHDSDYVNAFAKQVAQALEGVMPELVVSDMSKAKRQGKVLVDWSQNNGAKTTISPYSLRGRDEPTVAVPREWDELDENLRHLTIDEVPARLAERGDPMAALAAPVTDRLATYRSMRDAAKTPEPVPDSVVVGRTGDPIFVIQEHHASRLHWDFRLEREGVLVSWALPKGVPESSSGNHLAVQTEDHPLEYATFAGDIPKGEYGAGHVTIWDHGHYDLEKWNDHEVIATLHGSRDGGLGGSKRLALIKTGENWLIHLMKEQNEPTPKKAKTASKQGRAPKKSEETARAGFVSPMLAVLAGTRDAAGDDWAYELKWDGIRCVAVVNGEKVRLFSRNHNDVSASYPELVEELSQLGLDAVLDGEIVALDASGVPSFGRLQQRMGVTKAADVERLRRTVPPRLLVFDLVEHDGTSLRDRSYDDRREALENLDLDGELVQVPPAHGGSLDEAVALSRRHKLEGVVAKRRKAPYETGARSTDWLKIKNQDAQEVVIGGWRPSKGGRGIGSLLLGVPVEGGLQYLGRVGTGFTEAERLRLRQLLDPLTRKTSPFVDEVESAAARDATWVTPKVVGEVVYGDWSPAGHLRHASWRGLRPDKDAAEVVLEGSSEVRTTPS
ncbi:ATP-dependent DNA ligase [Aeromicrobium duanguangcaii]|uniref:ATP-dependent DNA ligase n=1 Tax=Aeromicrobium duanguangcaii TaxID=2968086 RepID=UPI0020183BA9|nr:ATP-dependent DNA ligase [Aeromicrobium duanguangcaii]MCL3837980.1 ATP-dependent DNA ligase [Aeromicrobium duanguangcaii]